MADNENIKETVRAHYGQRAREAQGNTSCCVGEGEDVFCRGQYEEQEIAWLPQDAKVFSLGCGNPTALAELKPGETVLDLGSGPGLDVFLSARRVGPDGIAYGLDMTDDMLELAERNRERLGVENARFLRGDMEDIPLPENSVDVIISNCVINLTPDKGQVLREAFRILKPGGRFAVSDIVVKGQLPEAIRHDLDAWSGCLAGALSDQEFTDMLGAAGFEDIDIETTRTYSSDDVEGEGCCGQSLAGLSQEERRQVMSQFTSAFVRARKPENRRS